MSMTILLILLGGSAVLELLAYVAGKQPTSRRVAAIGAYISGGLAIGGLLAYSFNLFSVIVALIGLYRLLNMLRVYEERMHERYLRRVTVRTSLSLISMQAGALIALWAWSSWPNAGSLLWSLVGVAQLLVALTLVFSVDRNLQKTQWPDDEHRYSDKELPPVTIAIPARNETEDLQACLQSAIASTYPKLEIIVLDDCSQVKRTPEIIKNFAQDGVRFVLGDEPSDTWLPKNQAYDRLAREASGEYILFCGVDVRFEPESVRLAVSTMLARNKQMLCILPLRQISAYARTSLVQAMRYWWELVPPRRLFKRPPVISSSWIIKKSALQQAGGFRAVARAITPEAHFARELIASDGYSFLRANEQLGITSGKPANEQRETAIRMRYPQLHRRPEQVALLSFFQLTFLLLPFKMAIAGFWIDIGSIAHFSSIAACVLLIVAYERSVLSTHVNSAAFGLIGLPFAVVADLYLLHYSMLKYEFSTVDWKGRNICIPAMHVVPHLPPFPADTTR